MSGMSIAITIAAIAIAFLSGIAVTRSAFRHRPSAADLSALTFNYREARRLHQPSKDIGRKLVKARTEQIRQECKAS